MKIRYFGFILLLLCAGVQQANAQDDLLEWMIPLTEEILNETDLCERCSWLPPTITRIDFNNDFYYFLRFNCALTEGIARMYDKEGNLVGECERQNSVNDCSFGFNALTIYTFAENIVPIWSCETGFECDFAEANGLVPEVPITVDDSKCAEGIKILRVSNNYESYEWSGAEVNSNESFIEVSEAGTYGVTVIDIDGCPIEGSIDIEDIEKLNVKIKGPDEICPNGEVTLLTTIFQSYSWSTGASGSTITAEGPGA
ncbi:MAG: hypothetical protein AAFO94_16425, partial [Bacteroidota bacterium]